VAVKRIFALSSIDLMEGGLWCNQSAELGLVAIQLALWLWTLVTVTLPCTHRVGASAFTISTLPAIKLAIWLAAHSLTRRTSTSFALRSIAGRAHHCAMRILTDLPAFRYPWLLASRHAHWRLTNGFAMSVALRCRASPRAFGVTRLFFSTSPLQVPRWILSCTHRRIIKELWPSGFA